MFNFDQSKPFVIGVSGGVASGKSEACVKVFEQLSRKLKDKKVIVLSLTSFYNELTDNEKELAKKGEYDLDHPSKFLKNFNSDAFDFDNLHDVIRCVKNHEKVKLQQYDLNEYAKSREILEIPADVDVLIVEGILTFYRKDIRELFHLKIFVDSDADTRLSRKVLRDVSLNGRDLNQVLDNYFRFVKPAFEQFCLPSKIYADVILPRAPDNIVGVDLIIEHLTQMMSGNLEPLNSYSSGRNSISMRFRNHSESSAMSIRPH